MIRRTPAAAIVNAACAAVASLVAFPVSIAVVAPVADCEVLFKDDFENGLSRWRGKHESAVPSNSRVVDDPLCVGGTGRGGKDWEGTGCRGKVLKMEDCVTEIEELGSLLRGLQGGSALSEEDRRNLDDTLAIRYDLEEEVEIFFRSKRRRELCIFLHTLHRRLTQDGLHHFQQLFDKWWYVLLSLCDV